MNVINIDDIENIILTMADVIKENRFLKERVDSLELKLGIEKCRACGKTELAEKLIERHSENLPCNLVKSCGWVSNDTKGYILDMKNLTQEELDFLHYQVMR